MSLPVQDIKNFKRLILLQRVEEGRNQDDRPL